MIFYFKTKPNDEKFKISLKKKIKIKNVYFHHELKFDSDSDLT